MNNLSKAQLAVYKLACALHDAGLIMSAHHLGGILNDSGIEDSAGTPYSTDPAHTRGIHKLVASTWKRVHDYVSFADAEKIAHVFTDNHGGLPWFDPEVE